MPNGFPDNSWGHRFCCIARVQNFQTRMPKLRTKLTKVHHIYDKDSVYHKNIYTEIQKLWRINPNPYLQICKKMSQIFRDTPPFEMAKCNLEMEQLWCQTKINSRNIFPTDVRTLPKSINPWGYKRIQTHERSHA